MKLVYVTWEDASVVDDGTWALREDAKVATAVIFHQVGWLHSVDKEAVVLTSAVSDRFMAPRDRIPIGMVRAIVELDPAAGIPLARPRRKRK